MVSMVFEEDTAIQGLTPRHEPPCSLQDQNFDRREDKQRESTALILLCELSHSVSTMAAGPLNSRNSRTHLVIVANVSPTYGLH